MQYSPARRTALVFCGTGAHGAYHAGVLRALQEAGVKIDVVAGHGVGAGAAMLAAIDGGSRLWEAGGIWRSPRRRSLYPWRLPIRIAAWLTVVLVFVIAAPAFFVLAGMQIPGLVPRLALILLGAIAVVVGLTCAWPLIRTGATRRMGRGFWWALLGAPFDAAPACRAFLNTIWQLIRGAAREARPKHGLAGRRYAEVLAENLGQPGFRELLIVATDLDSRGDVVAAMLRESYRRDFMAPQPGRERRAEALDLAGAGRDQALDIMTAALTPPVVCEPRLVTFAADGFWRGETHRLCDRAGAVARLFEELAGAGVSQVIVASAAPASSAPHRLRAPRLDIRSRLGEFIAAAEAASLHDAFGLARLRFNALYLICPSHNPVGPFDAAGAYDEASDRRHSIEELMERGYEDAYHQFIEPVVGGSGEQLARSASGRGASAGQTHGQRIFDDADPQR